MIENLNQKGYWVEKGFLGPELIEAAVQEMEELRNKERFSPAGITSHGRVESIRSDWTYWWEMEKLSLVQKQIFDRLTQIKNELNQNLYLGLWDFEGHYAIYPPGAFYQTHVDRLQKENRRKLSIVLFFNSDWDIAKNGGALEIHGTDEKVLVAPEAGTLVCFFSDLIPHQVLKTLRERKSFAGWFRTRG